MLTRAPSSTAASWLDWYGTRCQEFPRNQKNRSSPPPRIATLDLGPPPSNCRVRVRARLWLSNTIINQQQQLVACPPQVKIDGLTQIFCLLASQLYSFPFSAGFAFCTATTTRDRLRKAAKAVLLRLCKASFGIFSPLFSVLACLSFFLTESFFIPSKNFDILQFRDKSSGTAGGLMASATSAMSHSLSPAPLPGTP